MTVSRYWGATHFRAKEWDRPIFPSLALTAAWRDPLDFQLILCSWSSRVQLHSDFTWDQSQLIHLSAVIIWRTIVCICWLFWFLSVLEKSRNTLYGSSSGRSSGRSSTSTTKLTLLLRKTPCHNFLTYSYTIHLSSKQSYSQHNNCSSHWGEIVDIFFNNFCVWSLSIKMQNFTSMLYK